MEINWDFWLEIIGHHPQPSFDSGEFDKEEIMVQN
jgi:hypothetical protein